MSVVILEEWLNWGGFLFLAFRYFIICFYMITVKESSVKIFEKVREKPQPSLCLQDPLIIFKKVNKSLLFGFKKPPPIFYRMVWD